MRVASTLRHTGVKPGSVWVPSDMNAVGIRFYTLINILIHGDRRTFCKRRLVDSFAVNGMSQNAGVDFRTVDFPPS